MTHAWTIDEHVLPVEKVAATGRFDLADRLVCGQDLDHGFGGWGGAARLTDPGLAVRRSQLSSPDARFFQLYSPASGGIFVAEPVTHANAALNAPEERMGRAWDAGARARRSDEPRHAAGGDRRNSRGQVEARATPTTIARGSAAVPETWVSG